MTDLSGFALLIGASTWLLTFALHSVVAHAAALAGGRTLVRSPRVRSAVYRAALVIPLLTATAQSAGIRPFAALAEINVPALVRSRTTLANERVFIRKQTFRVDGSTAKVSSFATDSIALNIARAATALAAVAALLGLVRLLHRHVAFRRRLGERVPVPGHSTPSGDRYHVTASATIGAPVALGAREICVPQLAFASLSADERASVLAHEAAHLARHDPLWFALADGLVALFPWQPLARLLVTQDRRDAEFCCDDAVVETTGDGRPLVRSLAAFAATFDPAETEFAASCGGSPLEERARRLLGPASAGAGRASAWVIALALALLVGVVSIAPAISTRSRPETLPREGRHRVIIHEIDSTLTLR